MRGGREGLSFIPDLRVTGARATSEPEIVSGGIVQCSVTKSVRAHTALPEPSHSPRDGHAQSSMPQRRPRRAASIDVSSRNSLPRTNHIHLDVSGSSSLYVQYFSQSLATASSHGNSAVALTRWPTAVALSSIVPSSSTAQQRAKPFGLGRFAPSWSVSRARPSGDPT